MSFRDSLGAAFNWLGRLFTNLYFWGGMALLLVCGFGVYLAVDAVIMPSYTRHDAATQVPNVEDLPFQEAKQTLKKQNLQVQRQVGRYNPNVDTGIVVAQTPLPTSTVKPGRRVYLTVNAGEVPMVKLPDLSGLSVREAKNQLSSLGLEVGTVQKDEVPSPYANTITKQRPSPGDSLQSGNAVDLWYSTGLGAEKVDVPNVVGLQVGEARRLLLQNDLRSVIVNPNADAEIRDTTTRLSTDSLLKSDSLFVRQQAREPGIRVQAGTEIRLYTTDDAQEAAKQREALMDSDSTAASSSKNE